MQACVVANAGPFAEATKSKPHYKDNYFIPRAFSPLSEIISVC